MNKPSLHSKYQFGDKDPGRRSIARHLRQFVVGGVKNFSETGVDSRTNIFDSKYLTVSLARRRRQGRLVTV